jgi:CBS domain-containing protein
MDRVRATRIAANIGRGIAVVMGLVGFIINPWLVLIALFVWSGAGAEALSVEVEAGVKGLTVRDALITQFYQVEGNQPLLTVFQLSMQTGQQNIPVVSNGHYLGIIRRRDLLKAIERLGQRAPAYAAIGVEPEGLDPEMPLAEALPKFSTCHVLPVVENGTLIGLITPESVQQAMWLNQLHRTVDSQPSAEKMDKAR